MSMRITGLSAPWQAGEATAVVKEVVHGWMDTPGHCWRGGEEQAADIGDGNRAVVELERSWRITVSTDDKSLGGGCGGAGGAESSLVRCSARDFRSECAVRCDSRWGPCGGRVDEGPIRATGEVAAGSDRVGDRVLERRGRTRHSGKLVGPVLRIAALIAGMCAFISESRPPRWGQASVRTLPQRGGATQSGNIRVLSQDVSRRLGRRSVRRNARNAIRRSGGGGQALGSTSSWDGSASQDRKLRKNELVVQQDCPVHR